MEYSSQEIRVIKKNDKVPTYWITSWNEDDFSLHEFFSRYDTIDWHKDKNYHFNIGDIMYLYSSKSKKSKQKDSEQRIRYKTEIIKLNVSPEEEIDDHDCSLSTSPSEPSQHRPFRLKKIGEIDTESLNYENLHARGLNGSIRTPRTLKGELLQYINSFWEKNEHIYDEIENPDDIYEGAKKTIVVNSYERNREARNECIAAHGYKYECCVCRMDFEKMYGEIGRGFIHVHHIVPISTIGEEYKIDPIKDLVPVCPNCHAMLHKGKEGEVLTVDELKEIIKKNKS